MPEIRLHLATFRLLALGAGLLFSWIPGLAHSGNPPPIDRVFVLSAAHTAEGGVQLDWRIAPGSYLYRDKIVAMTAAGNAVAIATPAGQVKDDPTFGTTEVYRDRAEATVAAKDLPATGSLVVTYQGCAERGICYPPVRKNIDLVTTAISGADRRSEAPNVNMPEYRPGESAAAPQADSLPAPTASLARLRLLNGYLPATVAAFFGFGLLLSFTPCVFPMIPIMSGMLVRSGENLSMWRGLVLSGVYVLAMAAAYSLLGVVAAWSGQNLQLALQTPVALGAMSLVFVALALSMFGLYDLQLPARWADRLSGSAAFRAGSVGGAALLGFGSALIVGPCVTPPLAAALLYVAQTGDLGRGAAALFALGLGMGLPLLLFGTFGARLLPKSGPWLLRIKHVFGFVFIAMAVWMISRVLPDWLTLEVSGVGFILLGLYLDALSVFSKKAAFQKKIWRGWREITGVIALFCGVVFMLGAFPGSDLMRLLSFPDPAATRNEGLAADFQAVTSPASFDAAMSRARATGKPVLVDFSADWCVECRIIERDVFGSRTVQERLRDLVLIRADMTEYNGDSRALMQRFDVVGPPTMIFLDASTGEEIPRTRSIGAIDLAAFLNRIASALRF
jgi:thiol:disulfide interchange protein DsbD